MDDVRSAAAGNSAAPLQELKTFLSGLNELEFAVLVGSRATGTAHPGSDWDIALQWQPGVDWSSRVSRTESLRRQLAVLLKASEAAIDLIDLNRANLTMCAAVAEEGVPLCGEESLSWAHFLQRTWRDLEDFYWEQSHAA